MDRRTKRIWLSSEALGLVAPIAVGILLDMSVYGTFMLTVVVALVLGLIVLALGQSRCSTDEGSP